VSLTISQHVVDTDDRVACLRALLRALVEGLLNGWNVLVGDVLTLGLIDELAGKVWLLTLLSFLGLYVADNTSKLARTTRLLLVKEVESLFRTDGLAVVYGWVSYNQIDVVLSLHSLTVNEEVKLSHARYDDLLAF
jgi:hypothetical protein